MGGWVRRVGATAAVTGVLFLGGVIGSGGANAWDAAIWDSVAACESSGNWSINTGNGYYGGLQFSASTWKAFGGQEYAAYAHQATKAQQIAVARRVLATQGPKAWPTCSVRAGLTTTNGGADPQAQPTASGTSTSGATELASSGSTSGRLVEDGVLGPATTRALQGWVGTTPDGVWGSGTTRALQRTVGATVDGVRGPETTRRTQTVVGASADGIWGRQTTRALQHYLNERD